MMRKITWLSLVAAVMAFGASQVLAHCGKCEGDAGKKECGDKAACVEKCCKGKVDACCEGDKAASCEKKAAGKCCEGKECKAKKGCGGDKACGHEKAAEAAPEAPAAP